MMGLSKMTVDETEELLKYWENTIDGCKWSDEDRQLTIDAITQSSMTLKEWKDFLINVPNNVEERYRKVMKMLLDAELINEAAYEFELKVMDDWSPATLARRGLVFANWWRQEKDWLKCAA